MAKSLLEGIIVKPIGGRKRLPIPDVPGTDIRRSSNVATGIVVETIPAVLPTSSSIVEGVVVEDAEIDLVRPDISLYFNVSNYLRLENAVPPYRINLVGVEELSDSVLTQEWSVDNRFITMNENGVVTYKPRGSYISNKLLLSVEIGDERHPSSRGAEVIGNGFDPYNDEPLPVNEVIEMNRVEQIEVGLSGKSDFVGIETDTSHFIAQPTTSTCAITAVTAMIISLGLTNPDGTLITAEQIINDFSKKVRAILDDDGNIIGVEDIPGETVKYSPNPDHEGIGLYETVVDEDGNVLDIRYTTQLRRLAYTGFWYHSL